MLDSPGRRAVVGQVLRLLHLSSAVYLRGEFTAPWAFRSPSTLEYVNVLCPSAKRLVLFHFLLEGQCTVALETGESVVARAGEAIAIPYGDPHLMGHPRVASAVSVAGQLKGPRLTVMRLGGGGELTRILCSYLACEDLLFHPFMRALPPLMHLKPKDSVAADWLHSSARYALATAGAGADGETSSRLAELLLVECLRQYLEQLPSTATGWLKALTDPIAGPAIARLHQAPAAAWSIDRLARELAVSRTVLRERFAAVLGVPPIRYLTQWRVQLATGLLRTTRASLPAVAAEVGYRSEAAFSRAFKRELGVAPAAYRNASHPG